MGPSRVNVHDFADKQLGKVAPWGVCLTANAGWVNLGTSADAEASFGSIRPGESRWSSIITRMAAMLLIPPIPAGPTE